MDKIAKKLSFFITTEYACNYLNDKTACTLYADPESPKNNILYTMLLTKGFRRSGEELYRPHCEKCTDCIPVRIPVKHFKPNRNQTRTWKKNQDLTINITEARFNQEHFELYQRYLNARHPKGGMDNPSESDYKHVFYSCWSETKLFEFRLNDLLIAVAVADEIEDGFSAVYTFFDSNLEQRSLGKYAVLYLIEHVLERNYSWLYLGYWIAACKKMKYKVDYQPIECFVDDKWQKFNALNFAVSEN